jgi:ABC-2 type transport system ATP-binding protein
MHDEWAINLTNVDKMYKGKVHALRGIEMKVKRGEVFGLLGPNGAGKSTLVKILMTVIRATRADGTMLGQRVGHKPTLSRVGYLPEHHRFPEYLTGGQVIDFYGALANVPREARRKRRGELLELVGMSAWGDKAVKGYSKGMRQRIGIAQALVNEPDLVVLDEPTDGVDPVGRRDIRGMVQHLKERGTTVFLNSHLLSELEMVCDRVAILVQGKVSRQGTLDELTAESRRFEVELGAEASEAGIKAAVMGVPGLRWHDQSLPARPAARELPARLHGTTIYLGVEDAAHVQPVIDALRGAGMVIRAVRPHRASLEDLFMQAVTDPTTGKAAAPGAVRDGRKAGAA